MKLLKTPNESAHLLSGTGLTYNLGRNDSVWAVSPSTAVEAHRFDLFLRKLQGLLPSVSPAVRVVLCFVAYEGVTHEQDLISLLSATKSRQVLPGCSRAVWLGLRGAASRLEARFLSAFSELALQSVEDIDDWTAAISVAANFLSEQYPRFGRLGSNDVLKEVLHDASAWLYLQLPACLFSHVMWALSMPVLGHKVFSRLVPDSIANEPSPASALCDTGWERLEECATDVVFGFLSRNLTCVPKNIIAHLKDICSVSGNRSGIRLSDHLNSQLALKKLALSPQLILNEGWVAATLASWVSFLFSYGSLRLANPAVATISAYLNDLLESLAEALVTIGKPPGLMIQRDWDFLFENLLKEEGSQQRGAALSSLHLWAVRNFGCDPMPHIAFKRDKSTQVHSNIVWPVEQSRALDLATECSIDERVAHQVTVIITLGSKGLFRIGELPSLLTADFSSSPEGLRIQIDPGRGTHGGKSRAARRIVFISDPEAVRLITQWRDRRNLESKFSDVDDVYLLGDPNKEGGLYRFGHCIRLVNEILKNVTGCSDVSFHTLRHASATLRTLSLLTVPPHFTAVSPLHLLFHQIGHVNANTLWEIYFHLPELALRTAIDRAESVYGINASEASFWLGDSTSRLRKYKSRSSEAKAGGFYLQFLQMKAFERHPLGCIPRRDEALSAVRAPRSRTEIPDDLLWVRQALGIFSTGRGKEVACSRLSCTEDQLKKVCLATSVVLRSLRHRESSGTSYMLLESCTLEYALDWVHRKLGTFDWSYPALTSPSILTLVQYLDAHGLGSVARDAAVAWGGMQCRGALSLHDDTASKALLRLLNAAKLPPQTIVARVQKPDPTAIVTAQMPEQSQAKNAIAGLMLECLGADVRIETVKPRRGFPKSYLLLGRTAFSSGRTASPAGFCMSELHGVFFALCVFHELMARKVSGS